MGIRVAQALSYQMVNDYITLGNGEFVVEIEAGEHLEGMTIADFSKNVLDSIQVLLIKRKAEVTSHPSDGSKLEAKAVMILAGQINQLQTLPPKLSQSCETGYPTRATPT